MTDEPRATSDRVGIVQAGVDLGKTLVTALPPGFVMLCLINLVFLLMVVWFIHDQNDMMAERTKIVGQIITACIAKLN